MAEKTSAEVIIGGKVYTLSGYEGEEYLQKVATYINNKFPQMNKNYYVQQITGKDKILLKLLQYRMYGMMVLMSQLRRMKDRLVTVGRR